MRVVAELDESCHHHHSTIGAWGWEKKLFMYENNDVRRKENYFMLLIRARRNVLSCTRGGHF
jgi:hypothetical protein